MTFLIALLTTFIAGCGESSPDRATVTGQITLDGKPIEDGTIAFVPTGDTKGPVSGGKIENGKYSLLDEKGPVIGQHKVEILATRNTGKKIPAVPPATGEADVTEQYIPAKYNTQTTLSADIKAGENKHDFKLTTSN